MNSETRVPGIDWDKVGGLVPAVVQHWRSGEVLMLGYMTPEALAVCVVSKVSTSNPYVPAASVVLT